MSIRVRQCVLTAESAPGVSSRVLAYLPTSEWGRPGVEALRPDHTRCSCGRVCSPDAVKCHCGESL